MGLAGIWKDLIGILSKNQEFSDRPVLLSSKLGTLNLGI
jgi:hypothetical protein